MEIIFTKVKLRPAFSEKEGGQRAIPVSAVSQLSSAQNNYARVVHLGVTGANPQ